MSHTLGRIQRLVKAVAILDFGYSRRSSSGRKGDARNDQATFGLEVPAGGEGIRPHSAVLEFLRHVSRLGLSYPYIH